MKVFYIIFFVILNVLIFEKLTKKIKLAKKLKSGIVTIMLLILILHFFNPLDFAIPNKLFIILFGFSSSLFIFHYGSRVAIAFSTHINKGSKDKLLYNWYDFLIFYVVYIMISIFQIATIIKNWSL